MGNHFNFRAYWRNRLVIAMIPIDKLLHFTVSFVLTVTLNTFMPPENANKVAFFIGAGKEVWDYYNPPNKAELKDIAANLAGIILADKALEAIRWQAITSNTVQSVGQK